MGVARLVRAEAVLRHPLRVVLPLAGEAFGEVSSPLARLEAGAAQSFPESPSFLRGVELPRRQIFPEPPALLAGEERPVGGALPELLSAQRGGEAGEAVVFLPAGGPGGEGEVLPRLRLRPVEAVQLRLVGFAADRNPAVAECLHRALPLQVHPRLQAVQTALPDIIASCLDLVAEAAGGRQGVRERAAPRIQRLQPRGVHGAREGLTHARRRDHPQRVDPLRLVRGAHRTGVGERTGGGRRPRSRHALPAVVEGGRTGEVDVARCVDLRAHPRRVDPRRTLHLPRRGRRLHGGRLRRPAGLRAGLAGQAGTRAPVDGGVAAPVEGRDLAAAAARCHPGHQ